MVLTYIEKSDNKVIIPIEEWDKIISKLKKIENVDVEKIKIYSKSEDDLSGIFSKYANKELIENETEIAFQRSFK